MSHGIGFLNFMKRVCNFFLKKLVKAFFLCYNKHGLQILIQMRFISIGNADLILISVSNP